MRWIIAIAILASPAAFAEEQAHLIAFTEGRYQDAAKAAEHASTPDNLAFAARSVLAQAMSAADHTPPVELLDRAQWLAQAALAQDPDHVEARLQLAITLSLKARPLSTREAMRTGYGEEAKRLVDEVLEDDPQNTYAHGFLSVWHVEVRRRGGMIGASVLGASVKKARTHYEAAIQIEPGDAAIHWQYARALAALNARKYRRQITQALDAAAACQTESELEHVMQGRARVLSQALETQKYTAAERLAAQML